MKRLDPAWLAEHYLERRTTQAEMAELAGVSERTIRYQLRAAGIGRRPPLDREAQPTPRSRYQVLNDRDALERRISEGVTIYRLAAEIGCDRGAVRCALRRHGIDWPRSRSPYSSAR